mmetsp:Transcript_87676/g.249449  ORF Transcript_87676/g.249449 Transcript_87676/m.249449 type:complete len:218 (+) Transcript_87676:218-871(+)
MQIRPHSLDLVELRELATTQGALELLLTLGRLLLLRARRRLRHRENVLEFALLHLLLLRLLDRRGRLGGWRRRDHRRGGGDDRGRRGSGWRRCGWRRSRGRRWGHLRHHIHRTCTRVRRRRGLLQLHGRRRGVVGRRRRRHCLVLSSHRGGLRARVGSRSSGLRRSGRRLGLLEAHLQRHLQHVVVIILLVNLLSRGRHIARGSGSLRRVGKACSRR